MPKYAPFTRIAWRVALYGKNAEYAALVMKCSKSSQSVQTSHPGSTDSGNDDEHEREKEAIRRLNSGAVGISLNRYGHHHRNSGIPLGISRRLATVLIFHRRHHVNSQRFKTHTPGSGTSPLYDIHHHHRDRHLVVCLIHICIIFSGNRSRIF